MAMHETVYFRDFVITGAPGQCLAPPLRVGLETRCRPSYGQRGATRTIDAPCCIFQYTLAGEGIFEDDRGMHRLPPGTGFLCESHDPRIAYRYPPTGQTPWQFVYLSFAADPLGPVVKRFGEQTGRVISLPADNFMITRLVELGSGIDGSVYMSAGEATGLVLDLLRTIVGAMPVEEESFEDRQLRRIQARIEAWLPEGRIDLTELARAVGMSRGHLCRFFRDKTGLSPYQYILRKQMLLACQWLSERRLPVKQLADTFGFANPANFSRAFKQVTGMTTRQFLQHRHLPSFASLN